MDSAVARERALDAAEELFYGRGVQSVGMDDVRGTSGVSLKRLYQLFPAKELLVEAYLERRDTRWRGQLAEYAELGATSERVAGQVRAHKRAFRDYLGALVAAAGRPDALAGQLFLLAEGAMVTAGVTRSAEPAAEAREAARRLLDAG